MGISHGIAIIYRLHHFVVIHIITKGSTFLWFKAKFLLHLLNRPALVSIWVQIIHPHIAAQSTMEIGIQIRHRLPDILYGILIFIICQGQLDEIIINILKSVYILSSGIIFVQFSNIWLPLAQNVAVLFTTDYGINMRYTHGLMKDLHIFILVNGAGKHFLFPIAGISSIFCQKEEIILVLTHLIHQGIILTATGRRKNYISLFQLSHDLIKFSWQLAILIQQGSIHVRKNYFYHILHPVSPIAKRLATLQHIYNISTAYPNHPDF